MKGKRIIFNAIGGDDETEREEGEEEKKKKLLPWSLMAQHLC